MGEMAAWIMKKKKREKTTMIQGEAP